MWEKRVEIVKKVAMSISNVRIENVVKILTAAMFIPVSDTSGRENQNLLLVSLDGAAGALLLIRHRLGHRLVYGRHFEVLVRYLCGSSVQSSLLPATFSIASLENFLAELS